jgi:hypothetical protein
VSDTGAVLAAALAGAVVGGAATTAGSYLVGRTQRRHGARVTLYLDLLPELRTAKPSSPRSSGDQPSRGAVSHDLVRVANVAGGRSISLARSVDDAVKARDRPVTDEERAAAPSVGVGSGKRIDREAEQAALDKAIGDLDGWLERKIKGGWAALLP